MATLISNLDHDRDDLIEAILHHNATAMRCPRHWTARLDVIHERLNSLLTELEAMDAEQPAPR